jgi:tRNA U34 5-methylaminomethyl-2-thiouridine-forming methyltransferase MnmC
MWEELLFTRLYEALNDQGLLVTYCAKGEVRRRLQRSGFQVERIPGPPGKREMLRAVKFSF